MDLKKYKYLKFHNSGDMDYKIKCLLLLLDRETEHLGIGHIDEVRLIDDWLEKFKDAESYEMIKPFEFRKKILISKIKSGDTSEISATEYEAYSIGFFSKVKIFFKNLFNKN